MRVQIAGALLMGALGFAGFAHAAPAASKKAVRIHHFKFQPKRIVVRRGTRITWTNRDGDPHTVRSVKGHFASGALDTGKSFSVVLHRRGTFSYYCTIHPYMHGTVVVR